MGFTKRGELIEINPANLQSVESVAPMVDSQIIANFAKVASNLKRIAPKAEDFLYFSAVMMHAAEAALLNEDGTQKLTSRGEAAQASWDRRDNSWRWKSNDPSIKPYKNSNGDIFPEEELVKAHKKWIGKPLCIDHKSSSVDHVRGFIVDTYYDRQLKRVIALCALDKFNYPDLARKVATGYSNSVSMGTAVGKAICSDCGTVAKTEADFCKCMRGRTCYGEINVDLNPIELSIVVNGADPQAKIKHIIASQVDALNSYVNSKADEIKKLADMEFSANLSYTDPAGNEKGNVNGSVSLTASTLEQLKQDIGKALADFEKINSSANSQIMSENTNDTALPQTHSSVAMEQTDLESTDRNIAPPSERYASDDDGVGNQLSVIRTKLASMQQNLDKLATQFTSTSNTKQEEIMSGNKDNNLNKKGFYQGGGGVNEPAPGQVKYEKDPLNEHLRDKEDKHMVGQSPFPDVGNVEEMYPGNSSEKDKELKTRLLRADLEERALKRQAIVERAQKRLDTVKEGYFNGTTEPTPGKAQYPVDKLQDQLRDKEDKQMVGQKPFPGVGSVDGMHPSPDSADMADELKRKEKLLRAGLKARFVKAAKEDGSHDLGKSAWEVSLGDKLLLTASVDEITGGLADRLYSAVATKEFGADLISKVRKLGATEVAKGFSKSAQDSAPPAPPPADGPGAPPADVAPPAMDTGKEGDPKANALDLAEKVRDLSSDLVEAVRALTGEQAEMGDVGGPGAAADDGDANKVSTAHLNEMRKHLNSGLLVAIKEAVATLNDHEAELRTVASMYEKGAVNDVNKDLVTSLVADATVEAKEAVAESFKLLGAFVKYARGTQAIVKRAQEEELNRQANGDNMAPGQDSLMAMVDKGASAQPAADALDAMLAEDMAAADAADDNDASDEDDDNDASDADDNDAGAVMTNDPAKAKEMADKGMDVKVTAQDNLANRTAMRAKLAAEMKWHPMLQDFHKFLEDPDFDVKPSDNGGHFETIEEVHEAVLDVATAPPKVRKEAEAINELIVQGRLDPADLDALVANGVDPEAVKYWKQFYGQAGSEGSQFATELVKEHAKAQLEAEMSHYRVKIARAYELAYEMRERELIPGDRTSVTNQVDEIMKWNDESFESVKRVIASQKPSLRKAASGHMPQVGVIGLSDNSAGNSDDNDFASQLSQAFSKSSKRLF